MAAGAESPLHIKSWRNACALFLNRWRGIATANAGDSTMGSRCAQPMRKGWRETFLTGCNKQSPTPSGGDTGDDDMNRDELLTKLAMEYAPDEWGDAATWTYDEHQFGWNEYQLRRTELINRPSWDDAPEWAQWLAQDEDGEWWWYKEEPGLNYAEDCFDAGGRLESICAGIDYIAGHNWRDTLEPRPQTQSDIKTCRHCNTSFRRPHLDSIPDYRCARCDDEIKALWTEREPTTTRWTSKTCTQCGHAVAAKVSDDKPVCSVCVAPGPDISRGGPDISDPVNHPAHYQSDSGIECIDAIRAALGREGFIAFCRGNAIKYAWRSDRKGKVAEDVRKARRYVERLLAELEGEH